MVDKLIEAACAIEGCTVADLLYSRVRDDGLVVLIIGPAGRKRVVEVPGAGDVEEPPVTTVLDEVGPPPTFTELVPQRLLLILREHGLDDAEVVKGMSNKELEALPGIGRAAVRQIRGVLQQLG
jgi:hypothetical protein